MFGYDRRNRRTGARSGRDGRQLCHRGGFVRAILIAIASPNLRTERLDGHRAEPRPGDARVLAS
jgi:hypothetical protein